jgi:hypothetical protein
VRARVARLYLLILTLVPACSPPTPPPPATAGYATSFSLTEHPLSEGGKWITGRAVGLDWNDPASAAGKACAWVLSGLGACRYDDSIAHIDPSSLAFRASQFAQGTVFRLPGYSPATKHEIELLLRFRITRRNARGYEILWGHNGDFAIVRWNGPLGDYTSLGFAGPGPGVPADGDVLRADVIGDVIKVYKSGRLVATSPSITSWRDGQPGIGFWPVERATPTSYGWSHFEAGNL